MAAFLNIRPVHGALTTAEVIARLNGALVCHWEQDADGRLSCHWDIEPPDTPIPPHWARFRSVFSLLTGERG